MAFEVGIKIGSLSFSFPKLEFCRASVARPTCTGGNTLKGYKVLLVGISNFRRATEIF